MGDGTKRKLTMPPLHIPYLEKHRIYDLFHELTRQLVIQQPSDHVLFMKQILSNAAQSRDVARVVILSSPKVNVYEVARHISLFTHQVVIGEKAVFANMLNMVCIMISQKVERKVYDSLTIITMSIELELKLIETLQALCKNAKSRSNIHPSVLIKRLSQLLNSEKVYKSGWIVVDCIRTAREAKAMIKAGILPTHAIHLIPPYLPPLTELLYCHVSESWPEYRRKIMGVRDVFKTTLIEVFLQQKNLKEIVAECVKIVNIKKGFGGPKQPRILILGPRGCGRKTQAALLAQHLNIVHVDFEYLLCQAWISGNDLGKKLRGCEDKVSFQSDLLSEVVNKRILENDCLEQGWVLTGFPYTAKDFQHLDRIDTPPNRVVFLDCNLNVCKERLKHRRINVCTGSTTNVAENTELLDKVLVTHPKDNIDIIDAELNYYCEHYGSLRKYCGETACVVNGDQPERWVFEAISAILVRPAPACPPRIPDEREEDRNNLWNNDTPPNTSNRTSSPPVLSAFINQC